VLNELRHPRLSGFFELSFALLGCSVGSTVYSVPIYL
jgi:hypothetical protein